MRYLFIFCFYLTNLHFASAQSSSDLAHAPLDYLGIEHGLSNNAVNCIYQDSYGFMWFGTYDGLNRYDGYSFKVFKNRINDSTSLINNWIVAIEEDHQHNIWIGTKQGMSLFNTASSKFSPVYYNEFNGKTLTKVSNPVNDIRTDSKGNVFMATAGQGLIMHQKGQVNAIQIGFLNQKVLDYNYHVQSIKIDRLNRVWVFVQGRGLALFNYKKNTIDLVYSGVKTATTIEPDYSGNIWIGTESGLFEFNVANASHKAHYESNGFLSNNFIHGLNIDRKGVLWISTDGGGVTVFDTKTGKVDYLLASNKKGALTSGAVYTVYEDKDSRKWIGTLRGGINIMDERRSRFKTISRDPLKTNTLISNFILSFCEDERGNMWIGTDGEGLSYWDRKNNSFQNYQYHKNDFRSVSNNNIARIIKDHKDDIWFATYGGGINRYDKASNSFIRFPLYNSEFNYENKNAWGLYEDKQHNLWVGTCTGGGVYRFNRAANRFDLFDEELRDAITFAEDRAGDLWVGTFSKLIKVDRKNKQHKIYEIGKSVRAIFEDDKGNFWIGTEGFGLLNFDRKTGKFVAYTEDEGLPNNSVLNILADKTGNLWLSTFNGLARFNPLNKRFKAFYETDGLQGNQFNYNAALQLRSGEFVFGGIKGFSMFLPAEITSFKNSSLLLITSIKINNVPYEEDLNGENKENVYSVKELTLPYDRAVISIDFARLEFSDPHKISYSYYLEGWDKGWTTAGISRTANYSRLSEGTYTLRIKSTNSEGLWLKDEKTLILTILPPWWRSWWAYTLYVLAVGAAFYLYTVYQRERNYLEYQVQMGQLKVEQEKELNEKKLAFFTHISHEFRTPLTLIINPIKEFLSSRNSQVEPKDFIVVYRNARRLLSLVDQLLLFRKSDVGTLKVAKFNVVTFCKEVYLCFTQQAALKNITYTFVCEKDYVELYADKEKTEIALFNLVSNAFKYTPQGGQIDLIVDEADNHIVIHVKDNGPGIPDDIGDKLFGQFYQVFESGKSRKGGFGIGLYLVKTFIEKHKGTVSYHSRLGEGSDFMLNLLKGKEHLSGENISEDDENSVQIEEFVEDAQIKTEPAAESYQESDTEIATDKASLLIVDDNEEIRNYIKKIFKDSYELFEAVSGEEGLAMVKKHLPDIVITDVIMGELSGVELCTQIKEDTAISHIPVILLTSSSSAEIKLKGIEGGADDYITKPFDKDILKARVSNILKSRNNLQKYFYNEITLKSGHIRVSEEYKEFLERCISITEKHLTNDDFSIRILAGEMGMSHSTLYKKVKSISGKSINEFIRFIRLRKAAEIFINTDLNVNETALKSGFNDVKYFRLQFNKLFGMNPSEYMRKYRKSFQNTYKVNTDMKGK